MSTLHYRVEWLSPKQFGNYFHSQVITQKLLVSGDTRLVQSSIPQVADVIHDPDDGLCNAWYGKLQNRIFSITHRAPDQSEDGVIQIVICEFDDQFRNRDWKILKELILLPQCINVRRPLFIESNFTRPQFAVYRSRKNEWRRMVYASESFTDARQLVSFINRDEDLSEYFIGPADDRNSWEIRQGIETGAGIVGMYPSREVAIGEAFQRSKVKHNTLFAVRDRSENSAVWYIVVNGAVEEQSKE